MDENDIHMIHSELLVQLPKDYVDRMLNYPLAGTDNEGWELCDDAEIIVKHNKELRRLGFFDIPWPDHFFVIGSDGCGNFYFLNLKESDCRVYFANHENRFDPENLEELEESYPSIDSFISFLSEIATESGQQNKPSKLGKWWKFWE